MADVRICSTLGGLYQILGFLFHMGGKEKYFVYAEVVCNKRKKLWLGRPGLALDYIIIPKFTRGIL